jgi:hypothetical protein
MNFFRIVQILQILRCSWWTKTEVKKLFSHFMFILKERRIDLVMFSRNKMCAKVIQPFFFQRRCFITFRWINAAKILISWRKKNLQYVLFLRWEKCLWKLHKIHQTSFDNYFNQFLVHIVFCWPRQRRVNNVCL